MENKDVIGQWSEAARYWEKHRAVIERMFAPVAAALVQDAGIGPGQAVLDVATGPGEPALSIAGVVGAKGSVTGVDVVPAMIDAAGREAGRRGLGNARFRVAAAGELPFEDESFDAVVSRFGVMFFPSPLEGIREMLRVLKPGGKLAMAVWHHARNNPFHSVLSEIVERFVESRAPDADAPDAFRFAPPGKLLHVALEAGVADARERLLEFSIDAPLSLDGFWVLRTEMSDKLRTKLAQLSQGQVGEIKHAFREAARVYSDESGLSFPAEVLVVSGSSNARLVGHTGFEPVTSTL
ncbi:MAG: methyltransferase domain-containing protein [Planctomycetes bacterium]|nr:methyltransferase domain-containing protein [Planctomycetota bacterium]